MAVELLDNMQAAKWKIDGFAAVLEQMSEEEEAARRALSPAAFAMVQGRLQEHRAYYLGRIHEQEKLLSDGEEVLSGLPDRFRDLLRLYHVDGLTLSETAERMNYGPCWARKYHARALAELDQLIQDKKV